VKSPKDQADRQSQNRLPLHSVIKPTTNQNDDFFDSIGHSRRFCDVRDMSALHPIADISLLWRNRRFGPILLKKSVNNSR